ncbi:MULTISPECIES: ADP-ribosylglycohydrolase family protein [unclassified Microbacterium]|uniref:ADP-ribosylglycohydrolase family protein n=1 Tax=unclassified Microbacterium TaxID=2609290 RepID=UPI0036565DC7
MVEYISEEQLSAGMTQEPWGLARNELEQAAETGREVAVFRERLAGLTQDDDAELRCLYRDLIALPEPVSWPYFERSDLASIAAELEDPPLPVDVANLADRVRGAWLGRVIGNMMGKPVEIGPTRETIRTYLQQIGEYPLRGYVSGAGDLDVLGHRAPHFRYPDALRENIDGQVRDDDIDYTILGLHILETYGANYTKRNVAEEWLRRFPAYQLFTAERATYQNLIREVPLDHVGEFHNPYREWIGALIRADIFGYVAAGDPRRAALLAYEDASLSHRGNGIYGSMWVAALVASAFTAGSPKESIVQSLTAVPAASRLATQIRAVVDDHGQGVGWEVAMDRIGERCRGMSWVHTINNAAALAAAILWGRDDFAATVGLAVQAGLDTDSIGATAGSWAGARAGATGLPRHLVEPLHDHSRSAVFGYGDAFISDYAARTLALSDVL